jgi:XrtN system VIT domain protein
MFSYDSPAKDKLYWWGIGMVLVSFVLFCLPLVLTNSAADPMSFFIGNFTITAVYFFMLLVSGRLRKGRNGLSLLLVFLVLFLISAYSLNRSVEIFDDSADWFSALLVIGCVNYLAHHWYDSFSRTFKTIHFFIAGVSLLAFIYLAIYLVPAYAISLLVFFVLFISLHTFVPLLFCIYTIVLFYKKGRSTSIYKIGFFTGAALPTITIIIFSIIWANRVQDFNKIYRLSGVTENNNLPPWVEVARYNDRSWITERVLKSDIVYAVPRENNSFDDMFFRLPSRRFSEALKHDPLVMSAALFGGKLNLTEEDRIKIMESMFDARHQGERRLWSGNNLITEKINTAVEVWPSLHLAYTEKKITVSNMMQNRWGRNQEAIYTFQLPEGSVITSLSLWIEGKEEKAILTTKEKADSAYNTIVGVENRDPSVVHWREGNTVSVRVFPVEKGKSRLFKIGITSPLKRLEDRLVYENIYFKGPDYTSATEEISVHMDDANKQAVLPASFSTEDKKVYKKSGKYESRWSMQLKDMAIAPNAFSFNGFTYSIMPYSPKRLSADFSNVFLDINRSWTEKEFDEVWKLVNKKQVFVFDGELQKLTEENKDKLFDKLSGLQFSLFPFYLVQDPSTSLVITKNGEESPNLSDIKESNFYKQLTDSLGKKDKIKLFDLGYEPSAYLKTLREYRSFQYENGSQLLLKQLIDNNYFMNDVENDNGIIIHDADLEIKKMVGVTANTAPDHAMRLFAYNNIMRRYGMDVIMNKANTDVLAKEAAEAYVVSPVSSLVVLESQKDYDRFNIKDDGNSLKNASLGSKGSVPEPHEWALIVVILLALLYVKYQRSIKVI